jgi:heptaprenyl diphosphate synthase
LLELLSGPISDEALHAEALRLLRSNPAMTKARLEVQRRVDVARGLLESVPNIPARSALVGLCDLVTTRSS